MVRYMSNEKSMKDYENELERSFQVLREGDILDVTVIGYIRHRSHRRLELLHRGHYPNRGMQR